MRVNGFVVHGAVAAAVFASGVGAVVADSVASGGVTLAGPQVLRLIRDSPAALSAYPAVNMAMTMSISGGGRHVTVDEHGLVASDGKSGQLSMQLPDGLGPLSFIAVGNTLYAKASQRASASFGKPWVGLTVTPVARAQTPTGSDAIGYLRLLPGATGEVKTLGHQQIDHVRTTHYRVTVDVLKAEQAMPPQLQHTSAQQLQQLGVSTLPMDIWLDDQHAARQVALDMTVQGTRFDFRIRVSGTNTPVNVVAPARSDVYFVSTASELFDDAINR